MINRNDIKLKKIPKKIITQKYKNTKIITKNKTK